MKEHIVDTVTKARQMVKDRVKELEMAELLQKNKCWDNPPILVYIDEELCDDDDCDEEVLACHDEGDDDEAHSSEDPADVSSAIC